MSSFYVFFIALILICMMIGMTAATKGGNVQTRFAGTLLACLMVSILTALWVGFNARCL